MPRRVSATALLFVVLGLGIGLTGCAQPDVEPTTSPSVSDAPLFASEEEALAAATVAYAEYLRVSDAVGAAGGENVADLLPLVTDAYFDEQVSAFRALADGDKRTAGRSAFRDPQLQSFEGARVAVYFCLDVSAVRVIDSGGVDVTPAGRTNLLSLVVEFDGPKLLIASSEAWSGDSVCAVE